MDVITERREFPHSSPRRISCSNLLHFNLRESVFYVETEKIYKQKGKVREERKEGCS